MKLFTKLFLLAAFLVSIASIQSYAQARDTLEVYALPPGNLNTVINADTTAGGESAHVYISRLLHLSLMKTAALPVILLLQ